MKRNFLKRIVLITIGVLTMTSVMIACKKDKLTETPEQNKTQISTCDAEAKHIIKRIKNFDNQLKVIKQGAVKQESFLEVDSALWDIESLFNMKYSFPDKRYVERKIHELSFTVNVQDDKINMTDVVQLYDDIHYSVREVYSNDGYYTNKGLLSVILQKGELRSNELDVKVIAITGKTADYDDDNKPVLHGPFDYDECWYFGEYGGSCYDNTILSDAAKILQDTINYYHGNTPINNKLYRNIYIDMTIADVLANQYWNDKTNDYYLYYKVNPDSCDLYLDGNELNHYYYNELEVIMDLVPQDSQYKLPEDAVFVEILIDGVSQYTRDYICSHNNYILYAKRYLVESEQVGCPVDLLQY